jgi:HYR domain-containing protein
MNFGSARCTASCTARGLARTLKVALALAALTFSAKAFATATVASDKADYQPGDTAFLSGSGWAGGETVRLDVVCTGNEAVTMFTHAGPAGNFSGVTFAVTQEHAFETCTVTATGLTSWQSARTSFTDAPLGSARLSSVTPVDGGCVHQDSIPTSAVESWDVEQGRTYDVTLTNLTDCANGGTDATIELVVKSSNTGNTCLTASKVSTGVYTFRFTLPTDACFTFPIQYCTSGCDTSTGMLTRRADGGAKESHLRAATFGAGCSNPTPDTTCGGGCTVSIQCPTDFAVCNDQGQCSAIVGYVVTASGNCPPFTVVCNPTAGSTFPIGTTTVNCTATDSSSGSASCSFNVTVNDCEGPSLTCPQSFAVCNDDGRCDAVVSFDTLVDDNCPGATVVCTPSSGSVFPHGTTPVTCTATDGGGNTDTCTFSITVNDCEPPTISCSPNVTVCNDLGRCDAAVSFSTTADDNCTTVTVVCTPPSGSVFPHGTTPVSCTATDGSGNTASCGFTVTVNDCEPPTITCPQNLSVCNDQGRCDAAVSFTTPAADNCTTVTVVCTPASGSVFPHGTTPVSCTATDGSGNTANCSFTVTVNDCQPPTIACPQNITVCTDEGQCSADVRFSVDAQDNCPGVGFVCSPSSGSTFQLGTTMVTCTATDGSGNTANCSFTVTVNDCQPPTIQCPPDITANIHDVNDHVVDFDASGNDNCPGVTVVCDPPSGTAFPPGCTTVVCVASDPSGNSVSCDFQVCIQTCVGFDLQGEGSPVPTDTPITSQYEPLGLHVEGLSDGGLPRCLARVQGPPGSATDDLVPVSGPNFLQTDAGDGTSDSGLITFTFVDPDDGSPRTSSYARLTFLDIEGSGFGPGGAGRTRLEAFDPNGALLDTQLVPIGANGQQQTVQIGTIGGPLRIAMVVATIGTTLDSGGIDEFCYMLNPPDTSLSAVVSDQNPTLGERMSALVFMRNNTSHRILTDYDVYAAFNPNVPKRWLQTSIPVSLSANVDRYSSPTVYPFRVPPHNLHLVGRRVHVIATLRLRGTTQTLARSDALFVIR